MGIHLRRFTAFVRLSQIRHRTIKLSLALFLVIALVVLFYPEDSDASPGSMRRRTNMARAARNRAFRARQGKRVGRRQMKLRRGRTNVEAEAPPAPEGDEAADAGVEGEEGEEVPPGVTPPTLWGLGSTISKSEQSVERGASQTLDPMEVFPQKRGLRKVMRRSPLKKLQKNKFFAHKTSRHKRP